MSKDKKINKNKNNNLKKEEEKKSLLYAFDVYLKNYAYFPDWNSYS